MVSTFLKVPGFKVLEDSNQKTQKLFERSFSFFLKLMEGESPPSSNPPYQHQTKARGPIPQPRSWPNTEEDLRPNTCLKSGRAQMAKILQGSHCMAFLLTVRNGRERPIKSTLMAHSRHNQSGLQTPSTQARNQKLDWETWGVHNHNFFFDKTVKMTAIFLKFKYPRNYQLWKHWDTTGPILTVGNASEKRQTQVALWAVL